MERPPMTNEILSEEDIKTLKICHGSFDPIVGKIYDVEVNKVVTAYLEALNTIEAKDEKILILDSICNYLINILDDISNHVTDSVLRQKIAKALSTTPAEALELYRLEKAVVEAIQEEHKFIATPKTDRALEALQAHKEKVV